MVALPTERVLIQDGFHILSAQDSKLKTIHDFEDV